MFHYLHTCFTETGIDLSQHSEILKNTFESKGYSPFASEFDSPIPQEGMAHETDFLLRLRNKIKENFF